jgi:hypothetical protein
MDLASANSLIASGVSNIEITVDGTFVGNMSMGDTFAVAPQCNVGGVTLTLELGNSATKTFSYEAKDSSFGITGAVVYSGSMVVEGGECSSLQLQ